MSDRILVTGGAGFIGSHVCERLAERGDAVWLLDSFTDDYSPALKRRNIDDLSSRPSVHLVEGDVRDAVLLGGLLTDVEFDGVVHLAARPGLGGSGDDPLACYEVNVRGTLRLLEALARTDVRRMVMASSSSGHGGSDDASDGGAAHRPDTLQAASEQSAELAAHAYHRTHGLSIRCLRLPTVYGPRQRPDQALHRLARSMAAGEPIPDHGDGRPPREHLYVSDAVEALQLALDDMLRSDAPTFQRLEVVGPDRISNRRLAVELASAVGSGAEIAPEEEPSGDAGRRAASTKGARTRLDFEPKVGLEAGLREFAAWFRRNEERSGEEAVIPSRSTTGDAM